MQSCLAPESHASGPTQIGGAQVYNQHPPSEAQQARDARMARPRANDEDHLEIWEWWSEWNVSGVLRAVTRDGMGREENGGRGF